MSEEFVKENDYTLKVVQTDVAETNCGGYPEKRTSTLTRTFNFLAAQVTTVSNDTIFQSGGYKYGGSSSTSTQMVIQNFSALDSKEEIKLMHQKLIEMDGKPPALPGILDKKVPGISL